MGFRLFTPTFQQSIAPLGFVASTDPDFADAIQTTQDDNLNTPLETVPQLEANLELDASGYASSGYKRISPELPELSFVEDKPRSILSRGLPTTQIRDPWQPAITLIGQSIFTALKDGRWDDKMKSLQTSFEALLKQNGTSGNFGIDRNKNIVSLRVSIESQPIPKLIGQLLQSFKEYGNGYRFEIVLSTNGGAEKKRYLVSDGSISESQKPFEIEAKWFHPTEPLRPYQNGFAEALVKDVKANAYPWLAISSPMQTGKTRLNGPLIDRLSRVLPPDTQFIILSSAKKLTDQIVGDLLQGFDISQVGRFDATTKIIKKVTVGSALSVARNLADFDNTKKTVLILDEAYFAQTPTNKAIIQYFGLGAYIDGDSQLYGKLGKGFVIGYSGTGIGLDNFRVSDRLELATAIKEGWTRHMEGERIPVTITKVHREGIGNEKMVWWEPTEANAKFLAELYFKQVADKGPKSMIFVPTITHAELLHKAIKKIKSDHHVFYTHSKGNSEQDTSHDHRDQTQDNVNEDEAMTKWNEKGGAMISVRLLSRGVRAKGVYSVFHTYQTTSPELFAQRTGRAWAFEADMPDLYVLELDWGGRDQFANLAHILGLAQYPDRRVFSRKIEDYKKPKIKTPEDELETLIQAGTVEIYFKRMPSVDSWRNHFKEVAVGSDQYKAMLANTGIPGNRLIGYLMGYLPVDRDDVVRLQDYLGGRAKAIKLWLDAWQGIANDAGWDEENNIVKALSHRAYSDSNEQEEFVADILTQQLAPHFGLGKKYQPIFPKTRDDLFDLTLPDRPENCTIQQYRSIFEQFLNKKLKDMPPNHPWRHAYDSTGTEPYQLSTERLRQIRAKFLDSFKNFVINELATNENDIRSILAMPILAMLIHDQSLCLSWRSVNCLLYAGIFTVGDLIRKTEAELLKIKNMGRKSLNEIKEALRKENLSLGMIIRTDLEIPELTTTATPATESLESESIPQFSSWEEFRYTAKSSQTFIKSLHRMTGIRPGKLSSYLNSERPPSYLPHMLRLKDYFGGTQLTLKLWVDYWKSIVKNKTNVLSLSSDLEEWSQWDAPVREMAHYLFATLRKHNIDNINDEVPDYPKNLGDLFDLVLPDINLGMSLEEYRVFFNTHLESYLKTLRTGHPWLSLFNINYLAAQTNQYLDLFEPQNTLARFLVTFDHAIAEKTGKHFWANEWARSEVPFLSDQIEKHIKLEYIAGLALSSSCQLLGIKGFGHQSLSEIETFLKECGLGFITKPLDLRFSPQETENLRKKYKPQSPNIIA